MAIMKINNDISIDKTLDIGKKIIKDKIKLSQMSNASIVASKRFDIESNYKKFVKVVDNVMYS